METLEEMASILLENIIPPRGSNIPAVGLRPPRVQKFINLRAESLIYAVKNHRRVQEKIKNLRQYEMKVRSEFKEKMKDKGKLTQEGQQWLQITKPLGNSEELVQPATVEEFVQVLNVVRE